MTLVKVIDSTTWAGLTELDISESDDLSASLVNDTYRLIHSATTALVVAAVTLVSGAPNSISMTAHAATVTTPASEITATSAAPNAITMTAYAATVSVDSGSYTPDYVDNQGSANVVLTGSFATDSVRFWVSMWVNFTNDAVSSERMFEVAGRSEISRELSTVNFLVKNTSAATILDINTPTIAKDTLTHIFFTFDGTASTGGWTLHINGSDASGSVSTTTAWASGTVDHTRATVSVLTGVDVQQIGDLLIGANSPPALNAVYDGGPVDPSGVTATVKFVGNAAYWNANPNGYTTSGTFVDA